jgi:hypothetical protein
MNFLVKKCVVCGENKKFLEGTDRDIHSICGDCWDWQIEPQDENFINEDTLD